MITITENDFELQIIEWLQDLGWTYKKQEEIMALRGSTSDVLLLDNFETCFKKINNEDNQNIVNEAVGKLQQIDSIDLIKANQKATDFMQNGIRIKNKKTNLTSTYHLFDFKNINNNEFIITNQFTMLSNNPSFINQRPDIVLYINGIPVVIMELKSLMMDNEQSIKNAEQQIKNYQQFLPKLFIFNFFNIISNYNTNKVGSLTSTLERFVKWKSLNKNSIGGTDQFFKLLLTKKTILELVKNYLFFLNESKLIKIMPSYHQFYGVKKSIVTVNKAIIQQTGKGGIFWHTQGSGKSLSMVMLLKNIISLHPKLTTLVITDRKDLDGQLYSTFTKADDYINQNIVRCSSINDLLNKLKDKKQNGVFFSTVQKFTKKLKLLSSRKDILIIVDEAHRSHRNIYESMSLDQEKGIMIDKASFAHYLRKAFPKATFIGFTGTPIEKEDHSTKNVFGDYSTTFSIVDATRDGFVVPITYESRKIGLGIDEEYIDDIDKAYENHVQKIIAKSSLANESIKKFNKAIQKLEHVVCAPERINSVAKNFIKHYEARKNLLKGKAMFVAFNRKTACKYYEKIIQLNPNLKDKIRVIATSNSSDKPWMAKILQNEQYRKNSAIDFKDDQSNFKIAIVVDMWLTGFDVPILDTIYLDKWIKMHNLMQAIARINRVYSKDGIKKEAGLVVDYIGIKGPLLKALDFYTQGINDKSVVDFGQDANKKGQILKKIVNSIIEQFASYFTIDFEMLNDDENRKEYAFNLMQEIENAVISEARKNKNIKLQFLRQTEELKKLRVQSLTSLNDYYKYLVNLIILAGSQIIKKQLGDVDLVTHIDKMKKMIYEAITHTKTEILETNSNHSNTFEEIINYLDKKRNKIPAELNEIDIDEGINATKKIFEEVAKFNKIRATKLHKKLLQLIQRYEDGYLTKKEFLEILHSSARDAKKDNDKALASGKSQLELAFYDILLSSEKEKTKEDVKKINLIVNQLYETIKKIVPNSKDYWKYRQIQQKISSNLYKIMIKNDYPPNISKSKAENMCKQLKTQMENIQEVEWKDKQ